MSLTDDALFRELAERADRAVPAMSLDPAAVLAHGRRHRRRRTALQSAAGLAGVAAVALAAVGVGQLAGDRGHEVPAASRLVTVGDFTVLAATGLEPLSDDDPVRVGTATGPGTLYDTGVPVDPADPDGARWVLEHIAGVIGGPVPEHLAVRTFDPATGEVGERDLQTAALRPDGSPDAGSLELGRTKVVFGTAAADYTPTVYLTGPGADVPAVESRVYVPTFTLPGVDLPVYLLRVSGDSPWPTVTFHPSQYTSMLVESSVAPDPWGR